MLVHISVRSSGSPVMAACLFASVPYLRVQASEMPEIFSMQQYALSDSTHLKLPSLDEVIDHPHADTQQASRCSLAHQEAFRLLVQFFRHRCFLRMLAPNCNLAHRHIAWQLLEEPQGGKKIWN